MIYQLDGTPPDTRFPDPRLAETDPNGLLAMGGDLSPRRLLSAYSQGVFPWFSEDQPLLWWSPDPRTVLYPQQVHISHSLRRQMRQGGLVLRTDTAFDDVMAGCAAPRADQDGTWILPSMREAYNALHESGVAHSIELWQGKQLVGGMYGVALGGAFFGESMFSRVSSASKIVMVFLCRELMRYGYRFLDCQVYNPHLARMGAIDIPRERFLLELQQALLIPAEPGLWSAPPVDCAELCDFQK